MHAADRLALQALAQSEFAHCNTKAYLSTEEWWPGEDVGLRQYFSRLRRSTGQNSV